MIKATFHIIIAFSIYLSSGGFWVNNHYCQNELARTNFFFAFGNCCSSETTTPCTAKKMSCDMGGGESDEDKGCCENEPSFHILNQNQIIEKINFKFIEPPVVSQVFTVLADNTLPIIDNHSIKYFSYTPPTIITDHQVLFETFLC
ncbi:MAG: hypothetical protein P1U70_07385 [Saprospiraceae bacterium]|nr:hypothetical protein [Saprospiraceae bacterium]